MPLNRSLAMKVTRTRRSQWEWNIRREDIDYLVYLSRSFLRQIESIAIIYDEGDRETLKCLILDRIVQMLYHLRLLWNEACLR